MKSTCAWLCLIVVSGSLLTQSFAASQAKITLKVVDDEGKTVVGFPVNVGFYKADKFQGLTDRNGFLSIEGNAGIIAEANWILNKDGYYRSQDQYRFKGGVKDNMLQPWDPVVTTVVRRIVNPIPMYAKRVETMIPFISKPCGYDLTVGDWIAPNGVGKNPDVLFQVERTVVNEDDYDVDFKIVFTNRYDGLQSVSSVTKSAFTSPRCAPTNGYRVAYGRKMGRKPGRGSFNTDPLPEDYSAYRVRTVVDDKGRTESAYYGKITSGFRIAGYGAEKVTVLFTYYLNPTPNDRNLEFDPKRNLFTNLKSTEQVTEP